MRRRLAAAVTVLMLSACGSDGTGLPAVGTLERDRIEIVAEAQETLVEMHAREGEQVSAGTILAQHDDARLLHVVARAEAARTRAARRVDELVRGPRRESIMEAQAGLDGARERLALEQREFERVQALLERGLVSATQLDEVRLRRVAATAELRQWEARVEALLEGTTAEELDQAVATLAEAEAALAEARLALARLTLRAPRDGRVDAVPYKRGDRPPVGAPVVVLLVGDAPYARVYVPQAVRARLQVGTAAEVRVAGIQGPFTGTIRALSSEAAFTPYMALTERDRGRLSYLAEIALDATQAAELPAGMPVEVDFPGLAGR